MADQNKRERLEAEGREWLQNSLEGQQLRERFVLLSNFHSSPEWLAFREPIKAYLKRSEEKPLKRYIEQRGGRKPRPFVWPALKRKGVGDLSPAEIWEFLDYHEGRPGKAAEDQDTQNLVSRIQQGIKSYGALKRALNSLDVEGQDRETTLRELIPGIALQVQGKASSDEELAGAVANQIRREGPEQPHDPGKVLSADSEILAGFADEIELAIFELREQLEQKVNEASLTKQEAESWEAAVVLGNNEAAMVLDRSENQIAQEKHRANKKFRRVI